MEQQFFYHPWFGRLKGYYLSLLIGYLLVPLSFVYMTHSFIAQGLHPSRLQLPRDAFFMQMLKVAALSACAVIPLFALWLGFLVHKASVQRSKFDLFFASAPIGVPVFFFVLGWLQRI